MKIQYYNNHFETKGFEVEIEEVFKNIQTGKHKNLIEEIRKTKDKEDRSKLKSKLPGVTFQGTFETRKNDKLKQASGLLCVDIDHEITIEQKKKLQESIFTYCMFESPSGFSKILIKIPIVKNDEQYKLYYNAIEEKFKKNNIEIDKTSDINRLCYLSYDQNIYINEKAEEFTEKKETTYEFETQENVSKDKSRSAIEYREIIKQIQLGKTQEEIYLYMNNFNKWAAAKPQYKDLTYNKAKKYVDSKPNDLVKEVMQLLALKQRGKATELIVEYLYEHAIYKTTMVDEKNEIWVYKNGIYEPQGKCYIQEKSREILGDTYTTQLVNQIISKVEADTFIDQDKFFNQQNEYPEKIPVLNGILDIKTKEITPFSSEIPYFNKIPIKYEPGVKCDKFINFLKQIVKEENDENIIQELFGYSLLKKYKYKKSFMFEGGGDNGKSQLLKILTEKFLGVENTKEMSLEQIEKDRFIVGELHNKLVNVSADITSSVVENTGMFKNLTGGDAISVSRKFKNTITFVNYAKMIFATNELPISKDNSSGFWGRWVLIEFPHKFLPKKEYDLLSEKEKENVKLAIPNIIDEIIDEEELKGILNWALAGFDRLEKNKEFSDNNSRDETKKKWLMKANSVMAFIDENVEEDYDSYIIKNEFKQKYLLYCRENKLSIKSDKVIKFTLEKELGAYSGSKYFAEKDKQEYIWNGIKLSNLSNLSMVFHPKGEKEKSSLRANTMPNLPNLLNMKIIKTEVMHHKCYLCDFSPCEYETLNGRKPVCKICVGDLK